MCHCIAALVARVVCDGGKPGNFLVTDLDLPPLPSQLPCLRLSLHKLVNGALIIIIIIAGIAVNETHLTATGIHMSMGSHGITRHPTEATSPP